MKAFPTSIKAQAHVELFADIVLANPYASPAKLAAMCGRSQAWVIRLLNADWFQAMVRERREQMANSALQPSLENMVNGLAGHAMDALTIKALEWTLRSDSPRTSPRRPVEASLLSLAQHTRRGHLRD
jgi:hypothetical protein